jgi:type IX secretion system PorP/SprF family membrane protein
VGTVTKLIKVSGFIFCLCIATYVNGNDPYFAQFFNSPLNLNPAYTGTSNRSFRFNLNYRNYMYGLTSFETYSFTFDMPAFESKSSGDFAGLGLMVNNDVSGASVNRLSTLFSMAYHKAMNRKKTQYFTFGFQAGFIQNDANFATLSTQSQWVPGVGYDPSLGNGESFAADRIVVPDLNAGLMYYMFMKKNSMVYFGLSVSHLTEPNITVFEGPDSKLSRKYIANVGSYLEINKKLAVIPALLFTRQSNLNTYSIGANFEYDISRPKQEIVLTFGPWLRNLDAAVLYGGIMWKKLHFGVSYDFTISQLSSVKGHGGIEFSLKYNIRKNTVRTQKLKSNPNPHL